MHQEQRRRTQAFLEERGIGFALFADRPTVTWLTGFAQPVQVGESPFSGGPPLVWYADGQFTLIVLDSFADDVAAFQAQPDCAAVTYEGYTIERPVRGADHLGDTFCQVLVADLTQVSRVGIEVNKLPAYLWQKLHDILPTGSEIVAIDGRLDPLRMIKTSEELVKLRQNFALTDIGHSAARAAVRAGQREIVAIDGRLDPLRMIKTSEELVKLRQNFALTDIGHSAAREAVRAGQREIDVWAAIHRAVEQAAGRRVPLGNDCVVGYRQANIGGWPGTLEIRPGDSVIVDLSTILHGYWSDSCATYYAGERSPKQAAIHQTITQALEYAISLVRPGVIARELDQKVRQFIAAAGYPIYPHHTGHGVGVTGHEAPRIVPYNDEILEEGMVIMLEPGIYLPGETGVRLEDALLVTATGAEILTGHDKR